MTEEACLQLGICQVKDLLHQNEKLSLPTWILLQGCSVSPPYSVPLLQFLSTFAEWTPMRSQQPFELPGSQNETHGLVLSWGQIAHED